MDFSEQLRVLEAAQGEPAKLALATVDLAYPELPEAERDALKESLEAAAITHWCDEAILSDLLEISPEESKVRLDRLRRLAVVEPFPARGRRCGQRPRVGEAGAPKGDGESSGRQIPKHEHQGGRLLSKRSNGRRAY